MALQKDRTDDANVTVVGAYHRIDEMDLDRLEEICRIRVAMYKSSVEAGNGTPAFDFVWFTVEGADYDTYLGNAALDVLNQNVCERCYVWLKLQTTPVDYTVGTTDVV